MYFVTSAFPGRCCHLYGVRLPTLVKREAMAFFSFSCWLLFLLRHLNAFFGLLSAGRASCRFTRRLTKVTKKPFPAAPPPFLVCQHVHPMNVCFACVPVVDVMHALLLRMYTVSRRSTQVFASLHGAYPRIRQNGVPDEHVKRYLYFIHVGRART